MFINMKTSPCYNAKGNYIIFRISIAGTIVSFVKSSNHKTRSMNIKCLVYFCIGDSRPQNDNRKSSLSSISEHLQKKTTSSIVKWKMMITICISTLTRPKKRHLYR